MAGMERTVEKREVIGTKVGVWWWAGCFTTHPCSCARSLARPAWQSPAASWRPLLCARPLSPRPGARVAEPAHAGDGGRPGAAPGAPPPLEVGPPRFLPPAGACLHVGKLNFRLPASLPLQMWQVAEQAKAVAQAEREGRAADGRLAQLQGELAAAQVRPVGWSTAGPVCPCTPPLAPPQRLLRRHKASPSRRTFAGGGGCRGARVRHAAGAGGGDQGGGGAAGSGEAQGAWVGGKAGGTLCTAVQRERSCMS